MSALERYGRGWRVLSAGGRGGGGRRSSSRPRRTPRRLLRYVDPSLDLLGEIPVRLVGDGPLGFAAATSRTSLDGFGFVVPRTEERARAGLHVLEREVSGARAGGPRCCGASSAAR